MSLALDELRYEVTRAAEDELPLVYETWTRDYSRHPTSRRMPAGAYYPWQRGVIDKLLARGARVYMARDVDAPRLVYGWMCAERDGVAFVLHYVYAKRDYRGLGIAHALLDAALAELGGDVASLAYTHDPARKRLQGGRIDPEPRRRVEALGFVWRDIESHLRGGAEGRAA